MADEPNTNEGRKAPMTILKERVAELEAENSELKEQLEQAKACVLNQNTDPEEVQEWIKNKFGWEIKGEEPQGDAEEIKARIAELDAALTPEKLADMNPGQRTNLKKERSGLKAQYFNLTGTDA